MFRFFTRRLRFLAAMLLISSFLTIPVFARFSTITVMIQGKELISDPVVRRIGNVTYVPLRAFVLALDEEATFSWNYETQTAIVDSCGMEIRVKQEAEYIVANGRYLYLDGELVRNENGSLMLPIRPLAEAFGVEVEWDSVREYVLVTGEVKPIAPDWAFYDETSVYWLSHIIYSEAGTESLEGMIAVGQVVLNRKAFRQWPNTIYGVIFDNRAGVQFSPTANGAIYQEPSREAVMAAKMALEGADVIGDCCYFMNPDLADDSWFERNCEYVTTIGCHKFYSGGLW